MNVTLVMTSLSRKVARETDNARWSCVSHGDTGCQGSYDNNGKKLLCNQFLRQIICTGLRQRCSVDFLNR